VPDVLIVSGPCGVGKSTIAFECMEVLEERGVAAAMVDAELAYFHPKAQDDPHGERVAEAGLAALWPIYRSTGIDRLLLARVIEKPSQLELVRRAIPAAQIRIAWLDASAEVNAARLRERELGTGLDWHLARAEEIRSSDGPRLADFLVDASGDPRATALDVLGRANWLN
jgi:hypothetical protein